MLHAAAPRSEARRDLHVPMHVHAPGLHEPRRGHHLRLPACLQERCGPVKEEVRALLQRSGVATMRMMPVRRSYAFENRAVPHGEQWVLKVRGCP